MFDHEKRIFADLMDSVMQIYGAECNHAIKQIWWDLLISYDLQFVSSAFSDYLRVGQFPPRPADIIQLIDKIRPDGRPGADEAWAMIPRNEATSVVMTEEMSEALGIAQPLLNEGDQVGARMAFRDAYNRIVDANKRSGVKPKWFPSLGWDKQGRESVLIEAVRLGRLTQSHVTGLLPPSIETAVSIILDKQQANG